MYEPVYNKLAAVSTLTAHIKKDRLSGMGEFCLLSAFSFFIPFLLSNQLMVGTMVNMSLVGGALYLRGRNLLPVIILPSIGVLARGIIFGPLTLYLILMLPFIWIGNAILVFSVKLIHLRMKKSYFLGAVAGSVIKFFLLISSAFVLYNLGIIPVEFLAAMGIIQLLTAFSATAVFFPISKLREKRKG
jgi:hypothetical protein